MRYRALPARKCSSASLTFDIGNVFVTGTTECRALKASIWSIAVGLARENYGSTHHWCSRPFYRLFQCKCHCWSGVRATVDGQIRTGDVRRFRTGHERYQRGDFVNRSVAVERCIGLLGRGPIARSGI
jgi:hypothetical protein